MLPNWQVFACYLKKTLGSQPSKQAASETFFIFYEKKLGACPLLVSTLFHHQQIN